MVTIMSKGNMAQMIIDDVVYRIGFINDKDASQGIRAAADSILSNVGNEYFEEAIAIIGMAIEDTRTVTCINCKYR